MIGLTWPDGFLDIYILDMLLEFSNLVINLDRVRVCDDLNRIGMWGFD